VALFAACGDGDDTDTGNVDTDREPIDDAYNPADYASKCKVGELEAETYDERAFRVGFIEALNALRTAGGSCTRPDGSGGEFGSVLAVEHDTDLTALMDCFLEYPEGQWGDTELFEQTGTAMGIHMNTAYAYTALSDHGTVNTDPATVLAGIQASKDHYDVCEDAVFPYNNRRAGVAFKGGAIYWVSAR
jgi:hypothetical protein